MTVEAEAFHYLKFNLVGDAGRNGHIAGGEEGDVLKANIPRQRNEVQVRTYTTQTTVWQ